MKKMRRVVPAVALGIVLSTSSVSAQATSTVPVGAPVQSAPQPSVSDSQVPPVPVLTDVDVVSEKTEKVSSTNLSKLITLGTKRINERISALSNLKTKYASSTVSDSDKIAIANQIDNEISSLQALLTQIKAGTDPKAVKTLVESIYTDHRVYAVFAPKMRLLERDALVSKHIASLNDHFAKVQAQIAALKLAGKDTTLREKSLADARAIASTLTSRLADADAKINALKPADYPTVSKATIKAVNAIIKGIDSDIKKINQLLRAKNIKIEKKNTVSKTASSTVSH